MFSGVEADADEDIEIKQMAEEYKNHGGVVLGEYTGFFFLFCF